MGTDITRADKVLAWSWPLQSEQTRHAYLRDGHGGQSLAHAVKPTCGYEPLKRKAMRKARHERGGAAGRPAHTYRGARRELLTRGRGLAKRQLRAETRRQLGADLAQA